MAVRFEDECVGCPPEMGCLGSCCPNRNVPRVYCDNCGEELYDEDAWDDGSGIYMCANCLERKLRDAGVDVEAEDFKYEDYADAVSLETLIEQEGR